jgi:hypothetical protein
MIQVQLRPRGSHRHIVPVVVLYLLVVAFCDPGRLVGLSNWLAAAAGLSVAVVVGVVAFYAVLPFLYLMNLRESWFGAKFFGFSVPATTLRRAIVFAGLCLTYFGFVCRIWIISGLEAAFFVFLWAAATGTRLDPSVPPSWFPYLFPPVVVLIAAVHTLVERRNLGMAGLSIVADRKGAGYDRLGEPPCLTAP